MTLSCCAKQADNDHSLSHVTPHRSTANGCHPLNITLNLFKPTKTLYTTQKRNNALQQRSKWIGPNHVVSTSTQVLLGSSKVETVEAGIQAQHLEERSSAAPFQENDQFRRTSLEDKPETCLNLFNRDDKKPIPMPRQTLERGSTVTSVKEVSSAVPFLMEDYNMSVIDTVDYDLGEAGLLTSNVQEDFLQESYTLTTLYNEPVDVADGIRRIVKRFQTPGTEQGYRMAPGGKAEDNIDKKKVQSAASKRPQRHDKPTQQMQSSRKAEKIVNHKPTKDAKKPSLQTKEKVEKVKSQEKVSKNKQKEEKIHERSKDPKTTVKSKATPGQQQNKYHQKILTKKVVEQQWTKDMMDLRLQPKSKGSATTLEHFMKILMKGVREEHDEAESWGKSEEMQFILGHFKGVPKGPTTVVLQPGGGGGGSSRPQENLEGIADLSVSPFPFPSQLQNDVVPVDLVRGGRTGRPKASGSYFKRKKSLDSLPDHKHRRHENDRRHSRERFHGERSKERHRRESSRDRYTRERRYSRDRHRKGSSRDVRSSTDRFTRERGHSRDRHRRERRGSSDSSRKKKDSREEESRDWYTGMSREGVDTYTRRRGRERHRKQEMKDRKGEVKEGKDKVKDKIQEVKDKKYGRVKQVALPKDSLEIRQHRHEEKDKYGSLPSRRSILEKKDRQDFSDPSHKRKRKTRSPKRTRSPRRLYAPKSKEDKVQTRITTEYPLQGERDMTLQVNAIVTSPTNCDDPIKPIESVPVQLNTGKRLHEWKRASKVEMEDRLYGVKRSASPQRRGGEQEHERSGREYGRKTMTHLGRSGRRGCRVNKKVLEIAHRCAEELRRQERKKQSFREEEGAQVQSVASRRQRTPNQATSNERESGERGKPVFQVLLRYDVEEGNEKEPLRSHSMKKREAEIVLFDNGVATCKKKIELGSIQQQLPPLETRTLAQLVEEAAASPPPTSSSSSALTTRSKILPTTPERTRPDNRMPSSPKQDCLHLTVCNLKDENMQVSRQLPSGDVKYQANIADTGASPRPLLDANNKKIQTSVAEVFSGRPSEASPAARETCGTLAEGGRRGYLSTPQQREAEDQRQHRVQPQYPREAQDVQRIPLHISRIFHADREAQEISVKQVQDKALDAPFMAEPRTLKDLRRHVREDMKAAPSWEPELFRCCNIPSRCCRRRLYPRKPWIKEFWDYWTNSTSESTAAKEVKPVRASPARHVTDAATSRSRKKRKDSLDDSLEDAIAVGRRENYQTGGGRWNNYVPTVNEMPSSLKLQVKHTPTRGFPVSTLDNLEADSSASDRILDDFFLQLPFEFERRRKSRRRYTQKKMLSRPPLRGGSSSKTPPSLEKKKQIQICVLCSPNRKNCPDEVTEADHYCFGPELKPKEDIKPSLLPSGQKICSKHQKFLIHLFRRHNLVVGSCSAFDQEELLHKVGIKTFPDQDDHHQSFRKKLRKLFGIES